MKLIAAIYGNASKNDRAGKLTRWKRWVLDKMGPPTHIEGQFLSKPARMKDARAYQFHRYQPRFDEEIAQGNLKTLTLTSMASKPRGYIAFEWDWIADVRLAEERSGPMGMLGLDTASCTQFMPDLAWEYQQTLVSVVGAGYGFAAVVPEEFMPAGYAVGLACGGAGEEFVYDANAWSRFARKECEHVLRNVFGYNILSPGHLDIDVGGQRLEDWIRASQDRGRLEACESGLLLWTFQKGDDQDAFLHWDYPPVVRSREELKRHQIFPWQRLPGVE